MVTETIAIRCWSCNRIVSIEVNPEGLAAWQAGALIQNALPELSADDREMLISHTCPTCFERLFKDVGM